MFQLHATIKAPQARVRELSEKVEALGVEEIIPHTVPYAQFAAESRMNYDFVFREMLTDGLDVVYLDFWFADSPEGRQAAYKVEFNLPQIPLNLRYEEREADQ